MAAGTELIGEDAKIIFWCVEKFISFNQELVQFINSKLLFLFFFRDLRNSSIMAQFVESHNDDITQIQFHPTSPSQLICGSVDGLICSFDLKNFNEDDELIGVINSGSSINRAGYFGPDGEYVYCLTHIETFSLWGTSEVRREYVMDMATSKLFLKRIFKYLSVTYFVTWGMSGKVFHPFTTP